MTAAHPSQARQFECTAAYDVPMFHSLNDTLKAILDDPRMPAALAPLRAAEVSFRAPDKTFKDSQDSQPEPGVVNLFLHEVKENRELRDPVPVVKRLSEKGQVIARRRSMTGFMTMWMKASLVAERVS